MIKWNLEKMNNNMHDKENMEKVMKGTKEVIQLISDYIEKHINEKLLNTYSKKVQKKDEISFSPSNQFKEIKLIMESELIIDGTINPTESEFGLNLAEFSLRSDEQIEQIKIAVKLKKNTVFEASPLAEGARVLHNWLVFEKMSPDENKILLEDICLIHHDISYSCASYSYPYVEIDKLLKLIFIKN